MAELKTQKTNASVKKFIDSVDEKKREDSKKFLKIFEDVTKEKAAMWGKSIIGFGKYHYKSKRSSQEGDWFYVGFSPRKAAFSIYLMSGFNGYEDLLKDLGTYKKSSGCCLYIKKLEDVNIPVLKKLIRKSVSAVKAGKGMGN